MTFDKINLADQPLSIFAAYQLSLQSTTADLLLLNFAFASAKRNYQLLLNSPYSYAEVLDWLGYFALPL